MKEQVKSPRPWTSEPMGTGFGKEYTRIVDANGGYVATVIASEGAGIIERANGCTSSATENSRAVAEISYSSWNGMLAEVLPDHPQLPVGTKLYAAPAVASPPEERDNRAATIRECLAAVKNADVPQLYGALSVERDDGYNEGRLDAEKAILDLLNVPPMNRGLCK